MVLEKVGGLMEKEVNNNIIQYTEDTTLVQDTKYINGNIEFTYDLSTNPDKPFLLNNGVRLNHVPTKRDSGANNLKPVQYDMSLTQEERKAVYSKAGKASQQLQRRNRTYAEIIKFLGSLPATKAELEEVDPELLKNLSEDDKKLLTKDDLILLSAIEHAKHGSIQHQIFLRDTKGEKPSDKMQLQADVMTDGDRALMDKISKRLNNIG